ncbi:MAG: Ig-like domain-containing protein [Paludibacteraceae bacterium]|nr:Ig-like domain-containing protein [Paludibacteraceae bacterium]
MKRNNCIYHICFALLSVLLVMACANRGVGPQGGPKDETPPKMVKETPPNGAVDYHEKKIEITFDEYLQMNDVANQVLISPPQQRPPDVRAVGKKVTVTFDEDLRDSTTYTIDFGSSICDNNERNALKGYFYAFSTGPEIDTLQIGGLLINAENLNPVANVYVGIHQNHADSAFEKQPFTRIARTDDKGMFTIQNIHRGSYRVYALNDMSRDFLYQPGEGIAMYDSLVTPTIRLEGQIDTLFLADTVIAKLDSIRLDSIPHDTLGHYWDSIVSKTVTVYEPQDLLLFYFEEDKQRHYFIRCLRDEPHFFELIFAAPQDSLPQLTAIPFLPKDTLPVAVDSPSTDSLTNDSLRVDSIRWTDYACYQPSTHNDTIVVWLTDSAVIMQDTIAFYMTYMMTDSVYDLVPQTDTVYAVYRAPHLSDKAKAEIEKKKAQEKSVLKLKHNASASFEIYDSLRVTSPTPIKSFASEMIHLEQRVDTIFKPLKIQPIMVDSSHMEVVIPFTVEPEKEYRLRIDSAAFTDVYNVCNEELMSNLKVRSLEEYSTLIVKMENIDYRARIQLLNEKDKVIRELPVSDEGARFENLAPTSYYMRLYIDLNGDGHWTTGDWLKHRQPEPVYYFPSKMTLRANWDFEETFDINAKPLLEQKPGELRSAADNKKK